MRWPALILPFLLISSCSRSLDRDYREVQADSAWSVMLPAALDSTSELHEFAPIQFWNKSEAFFVVGLSEKKQDMIKGDIYYNLEDYIWFVQDQLCVGKDSCLAPGPVPDECSSMPCMDAELYTQLTDDQMEIIYHIRVCEGSDRFYQLICWTVPSRSERHRAAIDSITASLRELAAPSPAPDQASAISTP